MSVEQRVDQLPTRRRAESIYFVGRRQFEAVEVYVVSASDVARLSSARRYGQPSLDWNGTGSARMELSHLLITHVVEQRPSRELEERFALYVLSGLPDDGFVLDAGAIWRWLRVAGDEHDFLPASPPSRSWVGRLRTLLPGAPTHGPHV
jgi:hypothetical protein